MIEPMDTGDFWSLFEGLEVDPQDEEAEDAIEELGRRLDRLELSALPRFNERLARVAHSLDRRELAESLRHEVGGGQDYISPDDFLYRRLFAVMRGRAHVEAVLRGEAALAQGWAEGLMYVAETSHVERTGEEEAYWETSVSWESFENEDGWPDSERKDPLVGLAPKAE